jgi:hypothetical protein
MSYEAVFHKMIRLRLNFVKEEIVIPAVHSCNITRRIPPRDLESLLSDILNDVRKAARDAGTGPPCDECVASGGLL